MDGLREALEVFDRPGSERLDVHTLEWVMEQLLDAYPTASVGAGGADNVLIPVPESVPVGKEHSLVEGRSALDLLAYDENLIAAWERVMTVGAARCAIHLVGHPEISGTIHMLDVRERHGAIVSVTTLDLPADIDIEQVRADLAELKPRSGSLTKNETSVIVGIDNDVTKILGWGADEMIGHRSLEFIHPDDHPRAIDNWVAMFASPGPGRRVRLRHRHRDGSWIWMELTNHNLLADPEHRSVVTNMVDISEEMAAHEEVRARQQLLDRLAGAIPVGLLQLDIDRRVVYTNDRLHQIVRLERADTVETQLASVAPSDRPALERALDLALGQGDEVDIELELRVGPNESRRFCTLSLRALTLDDGTISGAIACVVDATDAARMRDELKRRATFDELTGCYNRSSIMLSLEADIEGGPDRERAVAFVDLDSFKEINDRYGHAAGDRLLHAVAQRLQGAVREDDLVGRIGGDEFLIVCPNAGGPWPAMRLASRLAAAAREAAVETPSGRVVAQLSVGVAWSRGDEVSADVLVARADDAMYDSKRAGGGEPRLARVA